MGRRKGTGKGKLPVTRRRPPQEVLLEGWDEIGAMFRKTGRAMQHRRKELVECGVVFYTKQGGPPPRLRACAFPTVLMRWVCEKAAKGERI